MESKIWWGVHIHHSSRVRLTHPISPKQRAIEKKVVKTENAPLGENPDTIVNSSATCIS
jgi:hypothetical protein